MLYPITTMAKLYVITGPAGVGKSTISRKIAEASSKSALIEGDDLYAQRDKRRPEEYQMKERCIVLLNEFKDHNYPENYILDTSHLSAGETAALVLEDDRFRTIRQFKYRI